jgi:crotonobetainyl-CoA:carnitine CoA-transferase CaiB-like acyl-CoA transferase
MTRARTDESARPLAGLVAIEFCSVLSGPWAGHLLAELGMDVIKVEPPEGDIARSMGPWRDGVSSLFLTVNHRKKSVCLDLKRPGGRDFAQRLIANADVMIENWRPGVAAKLGLDPVALRAANPRLVTVALRGYGDVGPRSDDRAYDPVIQAVTGLARLQGTAQSPQLTRTYIADKLGSLAAVQGALSALVARERTGRGTHVEASMYESTLSFLWPDMLRSLAFVDNEADKDRYLPTATPASLIEAENSEWLTFSVLSPGEWRGLCTVVGRPDWVETYSDIDRRRRDWGVIERTIRESLKGMTRSVALAKLRAAGVASAPVLHPADAIHDEQASARGFVVEGGIEGEAGTFRWMGPFVRVGETMEPGAGLGIPRLGEHSAEVARSLGYTDDEVESLQRDGALRTADGV